MNVTQLISAFFVLFLYVPLQAQNKFDHSFWDQILKLNVTKEGFVDYEGIMKDSSLLYNYFQELSYNPPKDYWTREEKMAYWINAYNAYTIKLVIDSYPIKSIQEIEEAWEKKFFKIDNYWLSLGEIENNILKKFKDPRIHFAINRASKSCPVLWNNAYRADNIHAALDAQTINFINDTTRNTITDNVVMLSKIFTWHKKDFKQNAGSVEKFINKYSINLISNQDTKGFKEYNWKLNEGKKSTEAIVLD